MGHWSARLRGWSAAATGPRPLAGVRTGIGVVMLVSPALLPRVLGVDPAAGRSTSWVVQMLGVREVAMGVGALAAGETTRPWSVAGSASDVVDALVVGLAVRRGDVSPTWGLAVAASALAAGVVGAVGGRR